METPQILTLPDVAFAIQVAKLAGNFLNDRPDDLLVSTKSSETDVVTHMDHEAEAMIVAHISAQYPTDGILGEESTQVSGTSGRMWIIDPLDGTVNYLYQLPFWAVAIALVDTSTNETLVGVVYAPQLDNLYFAARGQGAWCEHRGQLRQIHSSDKTDLIQVLLGTGFAYEQQRRVQQAQVIAKALPQVRDIRRMGSCAIDLCEVAAGSLDAFFERNVQLWDFTAGVLMVREAGGVVSGLFGQPEAVEIVVASGAQIHSTIVGLLESIEGQQ